MPPHRRISLQQLDAEERRSVLRREWLVTNGLGGYASGTISGPATRRYHGLLIAALPAPQGRRMMFPHLFERLRLPDRSLIKLSGEPVEGEDLHGFVAHYLTEFRLEMGLPVWRYEVGSTVIEKQLVMPHAQNTVHVIYRLLAGDGPVRLKLRVCVHHRSHDDPVSTPLPPNFRLTEEDGCYEVSSAASPALKFMARGQRQAFTVERAELPEVDYPVEEERGYESRGVLWSPGYFRVDLSREAPAALIASTESWETLTALAPDDALRAERERRNRQLAAAGRESLAGELVMAADQFIVEPVGRSEEAARVQAEGDEVRSVIAGYHWFTDWGRDTMISLEGLTLATGRYVEAGYILRMFGHYVRDGLLPNLFPEGEREGLYHTADATLWFFHAIDRYLGATGDEATLEILLPKLVDIAEHHLRGTRFGIAVDRKDGLLRQGQEDYQLTWMDAKVQGWVVTPRRGKAVEINALWYNALCLLSGWLHRAGRVREANDWAGHAGTARESFNRRFWYDEGGYLYDVVDGEQGDDNACRPNQVMAISLAHPVLQRERWEPVLETVRGRLLTPLGLRTLSQDHPDYCARYYGDLRSRDAAYHQGTVWAWLLGPFVDAWLKTYPGDGATARGFLSAFDEHLNEAGIGSISEIFDAEAPFTPRGCIAQAWSVAEVLRCLVKTEGLVETEG